MKTNAIIRIVIYSIVILLLVGLLLTCLGIGAFMLNFKSGTGEYNTGEGSVPALDIHNLDIEWAAGSVTIQAADTDKITFTESGNFTDDYAMVFKTKNGTLKLEYSKPSVSLGFVSTPSKDLTITVPENWVCDEIEIDGAALEVDISGITTETLQLNGAAMELSFTGDVKELNVDGAACELNIVSSGNPDVIEIDGASCELNLTVPKSCGMLIQADGIALDFDSDAEFTRSNGNYLYGDGGCKVDVDGISCQLNIHFGEIEPLPTIPAGQ